MTRWSRRRQSCPGRDHRANGGCQRADSGTTPGGLNDWQPDFNTVVVDEAHHAAGRDVTRGFSNTAGRGTTDGPLIVGVTATPERGDKHVPRGSVRRNRLPKVHPGDDAAGYLCDLRAVQVLLHANFDALHTTGMAISSRASWRRALHAAMPPQQVLEAFQDACE